MMALRRSSTTFGEFSTRHIKEALVGETHKLKYFSVSVLLKMLELFAKARTDGSNVITYSKPFLKTNVFLGTDFELQLKGMTLMEGKVAAKKYRDVLIYLDEIPAMDVARMTDFQECLFLRNMIRCLSLPCLLSGTESTLLDVMASVKESRTEGLTEYAWLLAKFPTTQLDQLGVQTDRFGEYEKHLMSCSRPLFVQWFAQFFEAASQGGGPPMYMTPATLIHMKHEICKAKEMACVHDDSLSWLHASTLLVFANSLAGSGEVTASVAPEDATQIGEKRTASSLALLQTRKKQKLGDLRDNIRRHSLVIKKHFALLHIASELVDKETGMAKLFVNGDTLYNINNLEFKVKAAFPTCAEDPLLYLACLRGGLMCRDTSAANFVQVPSSYAFTTFHVYSAVGNGQAPSNDGTGLEAECMAAVVLAAHRYNSFGGTPFLRWLALVIAELSHHKEFKETPIDVVPTELQRALEDLHVPVLSPPNCPWGEESMNSNINVANLVWCKNKDMRDGLVPLDKSQAVRSAHIDDMEGGEHGEAGFLFRQGIMSHGIKSLVLEFKDKKKNFGGDEVATITKKIPKGSLTVLICSHLADWKETTKAEFAKDVSVYRMNDQRSIKSVSTEPWKPGRKLLIALNLNTLHPDRYAALPHST